MKKNSKKLQLNKETVRQISAIEAKQVFGGMGIYDTLLDCPYSRDSLCPVGLCAENAKVLGPSER